MQIFIDQAQKKEDERKEEEMAEKIKASFRASEAQKTEWVHIDMAAQLLSRKDLWRKKSWWFFRVKLS